MNERPLDASRHEQLSSLFDRAVQLPSHEQQAFALANCGDDVAMRDQLLALLAAQLPATAFFDDLERTVIGAALDALADSEDGLQETLQKELEGVYRISQELPGGAMSRVFVADDVALGRSVVLKVLRRELVSTADAARFRREIELAAQLQHTHIVPVLTAGTAGDAAYYAMPFVAGETLRDRIARDGALPVDEALHIWRDLLDALAYAHGHGVIHRDVKPGNIMLSGRHALVMDFGVARAIEVVNPDPRATSPGIAIGTPAYMAPEQVAGDADANERADLYAAGLVMYEMLAGTQPFVARSSREYMIAHLTLDPPPLGPQIPSPLADVVMRCLAKDPDARPERAEAILQLLDTNGGELHAAAGSRTVARTRTIAQPRRLALYATALVALIALALSIHNIRTKKLQTRGVASASPSRIAAHEWYLRGMDLSLIRSRTGALQAVDYFKHAIALDTTYAAAYAGLARTYWSLWSAAPLHEQQQWLDSARNAAAMAMRREPASADALSALAMTQLIARDFAGAEASYKRALAIDPAVPRGHEGLARVYMMMRRPKEQLAEARLGVATDSFSHSATRELALALGTNGRCREALEPLRALKVMTPPAAVAGVLRGQCFASRADWKNAIDEFRWADTQGATYARAGLGFSLARGGRKEEATAILDSLLSGSEESHGAFGIATVYAGLRDYDHAFEWLERALDQNTVNAYIMLPMYADLQRDPRFDGVIRRLNIPVK